MVRVAAAKGPTASAATPRAIHIVPTTQPSQSAHSV
jgi:hypothetical protein